VLGDAIDVIIAPRMSQRVMSVNTSASGAYGGGGCGARQAAAAPG